MSKNAIMSKGTKEISLKGAQELVARVNEGMKVLNDGYLAIAPDVAKLYDCKGFKALGYPNYDEMCKNEFGMSHGTATGIRAVFKRFGSVSPDNVYSIPDKYRVFGYTKLLLFANDATKFENAGINPLEVFTPDMTIREMKDTLSKALTDKASAQDESAIDTTSEDVAQDTTSEDVAQDTTSEDVAQNTTSEVTPLEMLSTITEYAKLLKELSEMNNWLKPEKLVLFDAIIANTKELKKLLK